MREQVLQQLHESRTAGHPGISRTADRVRSRFYWPGMKGDVTRYVQCCEACARSKALRRGRAPLQQLPVGAPLERLACDIVGEFPESERGNKFALVLSDYYSKWLEIYALPDCTAYSCAEAIVTGFICTFGTPVSLHSDQGRNFESELFSEMCKLLGIQKTRTVSYRPQSDGLVGRANRTFQQMLKSFLAAEEIVSRTEWDEMLPYVAMSYRATVHQSTGCTPNLLMLGREIHLPVDIMYGVPPRHEARYRNPNEYVESLRRAMGKAFEFARKNLKMAAMRQKRGYNVGTRSRELQPGTYAWRYIPLGGSKKLTLSYHGPYRVISKASEVNYYVQRKPASRVIRCHIDHLIPHQGRVPPAWRDFEEAETPADEEEVELAREGLAEAEMSEEQSEDSPTEEAPFDQAKADPDITLVGDGAGAPRRSGRERWMIGISDARG